MILPWMPLMWAAGPALPPLLPPQQEERRPEPPPSFLAFLARFKEDRVFQRDHVQYPLKVECWGPGESSSLEWSREDLVKIQRSSAGLIHTERVMRRHQDAHPDPWSQGVASATATRVVFVQGSRDACTWTREYVFERAGDTWKLVAYRSGGG